MKKNFKTGFETYSIEIAQMGKFTASGENVFFALDALKKKLKINSSAMIIVSAFLIKGRYLKFDVTELVKI